MAKIFVSWPGYARDDPAIGGRLVGAGYELVLAPRLGQRTPDELAALARGCVGAIVSTDPFTADVISALPSLKVISRVGVGYDSIDVDAATGAGIAITITPGMNKETVADHTLALILSMLRKTPYQDHMVKSGGWDRVGTNTPNELSGKTVGLVGAGAIGQAVIQRLSGFGVTILYHDNQAPHIPQAEKVDGLMELYQVADIISLHAPLTPHTCGLINQHAIAMMKPTTWLVNTSRGPLVDQDALFSALSEKRLAGAALDVFDTEPPGAAVLSGIPNLICTAHMGGISVESVERMTISATSSVLAVLNGEITDTIINPEALLNAPADEKERS